MRSIGLTLLIAFSKGMQAVNLMHQQYPPVLDWKCWLTQVDLYNGHKTVVCVLLKALT